MAYFRGYIFDLDGTIYLGEKLIPGALATISELRGQGCKVVFLSNKPLQPREVYAQKLTRMGIPASEKDVINSSNVLAHYLLREMPDANIFIIGEQPLLTKWQRLVSRSAMIPTKSTLSLPALTAHSTTANWISATRPYGKGHAFLQQTLTAPAPLRGEISPMLRP